MMRWRHASRRLAGMLAIAVVPLAMASAAPTSIAPVKVETCHAGAFELALRADTQTLARLSPQTEPGFDFTLGRRLAERQGDGYVQIGDIHIRLRTGRGPWRDFASEHARRPITPLTTDANTLAAADITATLGQDFPLKLTRSWVKDGDSVVMRFVLSNPGKESIDIGALGLPMVFDNILAGRSLEQAHTQASFADPYVGEDAGYVQVTRLNGHGPALLVMPEAGTPLEAWRPIADARHAKPGDLFTDRDPRGQTAEGFYDWTVASRGFAEREWAQAGEPWNVPSSFMLKPGQTRTLALRFVLSPSIRAIESTLIRHQRPVAIGIPGYVIPTDLTASLFLHSPQPVTHIDVQPKDALELSPASPQHGWSRYTVHANGWGRARVTLHYQDGSVQTVSYFITKPLQQAVADLGHFATTREWFDDPNDPFRRAPAILTFDREANAIVTQEPRVWIAGMSDEGGAGSWVAAMMKQLDNPDPVEVAKLERLIDETVVGKLQVATGAHAGAVRKSLFYYDAAAHRGYYDPQRNWSTWTSWSKQDADDLGRSYNYPHVAIGHWVMYRLARNHVGLVARHDGRWYLDHAYQTAVAMMRDAPYYAQFGQMEGEVFVEILKDLQREHLDTEAANLTRLMKARADHWRMLAYPFGSEMPWDSTGQPEVYAWMRYFGYQTQAAQTREVILGYDPAVPSWGYNGNARRYWDFLYAGKLARIERQIHHYGSALNAVPLFDAYRADPSDFYLLRVAYGGLLGGIANIDRDGFAAAAFHSDPDAMRFDAYSGDYGMGFFGHAYASATYLVDDPTFGWLSFGGNLTHSAGGWRLTPRDSARTRVFIAPASAWLTLSAGKFESVDYQPGSGDIILHLAAADAHTPVARLSVEATTTRAPRYQLEGVPVERGQYMIALHAHPTTVHLVVSRLD